MLQEQIFKMVLRGHIDFKTDPWPKLSEAAKDCVRRLLEQDPTKRATTQQVGVRQGSCGGDAVSLPGIMYPALFGCAGLGDVLAVLQQVVSVALTPCT
jgi:hypothetical protein